ncbi:MAG: lysophospholipid acyltransferase family protein [Chakrabartia sp.]
MAFTAIASLWLILPRALGSRLPRLAFGILCRAFGLIVEPMGLRPKSPALLLANHVSWTDIAVFAAITDTGFVAKREVRDWPFIGRLAERYGCLFIARDRRAAVGGETGQLATLIRARSIILFPEGTTGDGQVLLPFRSSLIGAVATDARPCVPVALAYSWADGRPLRSAGWAQVSWTGDASLLPHVLNLAMLPPLRVRILFGDTLTGTCRKALTQEAENQIRTALVTSYGG